MTISKKRLAEIEAMPDQDIDTSDIPEVDEDFFATAKLIMPTTTKKVPVSMRVDDDVLAWFKSQGERGYQTRMNAVLRAYVQAHQPK
jgi:uncharacterized protein (DUF4415 family)